MKTGRRTFIKSAAVAAAGWGLASSIPAYLLAEEKTNDLFFRLAISQFSLASQFWTKKLDPLDFPEKVKNDFGITGLDYCSMFFADKAKDRTFLQQLKGRAADAGSYNLRIMVDGEGVLGDLDETVRIKAVENHYKWIDAAGEQRALWYARGFRQFLYQPDKTGGADDRCLYEDKMPGRI